MTSQMTRNNFNTSKQFLNNRINRKKKKTTLILIFQFFSSVVKLKPHL